MKGVKKLEKQPIPLDQIKENVILIDWLTVTIHSMSVLELQRILGLDPKDFSWIEQRVFRNGYPMQSTYNNINIRWGADQEEFYSSDEKKSAAEKVRHDMGICLDISGQGCRAFEQYGAGDWFQLLSTLCNSDRKVNFTRLDLAYDDHTGILDMVQMKLDLEERNYTSPSKKSSLIWSDDQEEDIQGLTLKIGSDKSPVLIRIYNKAAERGFDHTLHWIRVELQLRDDRAFVAIAKLLDHQDVGKVMTGILRNYLTFREPTDDTNKSRWPIAGYWQVLLGDAEKISLWISPGEPYNFSKTQYYLVEQYGQALICHLMSHGSFAGLISAAKQRHPVLAKKYQAVVDEAERQRLERKRKSQEVRKYYGFEPLPDDDPDYQIDIAELFNCLADDFRSFESCECNG